MEEHYNGDSQNLQIISVTSVSPAKLSEPQQVCQVTFSDHNINISRSSIQGCYQTVLYYEKMNDAEEHDWSLTGWIVDSLAKALLEYPLLAGRLKRREVGDDNNRRLEIASNDSGIRLLEARCLMRLSEFLEFNKKEHHEPRLVFWKEIDAQFPQFSPLFYVQVTNFICGGYSIGISCSLLLAEVSVVDNFLKKWAQIIHMVSQNEKVETSIFKYGRLKNLECLPSEDEISHTQSKNRVQSMIFRIITKDENFSKELWRELATLCIQDAEQKLDRKIGSSFVLIVKQSSEVIEVESCTKGGYNQKESSLKDQIICVTLKYFGLHGIVFHEENKPVHVSCWIGSVVDGYVMIVPCPEENSCDVIVVSPR